MDTGLIGAGLIDAGLIGAGLIERLRGEIRRAETAGRAAGNGGDVRFIASGVAALDQLLPEGGYQPGSLVEWLAPSAGGGAELLGLLLARSAAQSLASSKGSSSRLPSSSAGLAVSTGKSAGAIVVIDPRGDFYPPAAARLGLRLEQLIVIRHPREEELYWAIEQALRSPAIAAVYAVASLGTHSPFLGSNLDERWLRRFQLAAEQGGGLGIFVRPLRVAGQPTWSDVQWRVEVAHCDSPSSDVPAAVHGAAVHGAVRQGSEEWPASEEKLGLRVQLLRCRGAAAGQTLWLECDLNSGQLGSGQVRWAKRMISSRMPQAVSAEVALPGPTGWRRSG